MAGVDPRAQAIFDRLRGGVDPKAQAVFDRLRGAGPAQAIDPRAQAVFDQLRQHAQPPPPVVLPAPEPPPTPFTPSYPVGAQGRVVDPTTGQEFPRMGAGGAHEAPPQTMGIGPVQVPRDVVEGGLNAAAATLPWAFKYFTVRGIDQGNYLLNKAMDDGLQAEKERGTVAGLVAFVRGLVTHAPEALVQGTVGPTVEPRWIKDAATAAGAGPWVAGGAEFLGSIFSDAWMSRAGVKLTGFLAGRMGKAAEVAGLFDRQIPVVGQSVHELQEAKRVRDLARQEIIKNAAKGAQYRREGEQALKQNEQIFERYRREGVDFARPRPGGGPPVNVADQHVLDWMEAGSKGARAATRAEVEKRAAADGFKPEDLRQVAGNLRQVYGKVGLWLEEAGLMKPGTVAKFGDQYIAQVYHFASRNADDIDAALEAAEKMGALDPRASELAGKVLRQMDLKRGGGYSPLKGRKDLTAETREALGKEYQANVAFAHSLPKHTKLGAHFGAIKDIAENPELFVPATRTEQKAAKFTGEQVEALTTAARDAKDAAAKAKGALDDFETDLFERWKARNDEAHAALARYEAQIEAAGGMRKIPKAKREQVQADLKRLREQAKAYAERPDAERMLQELYRPAERKPHLEQWQKLRREAKAAESAEKKALRQAGEAARQTSPTEIKVANEGPPGWTKAKIGPHEGWWHPQAIHVIDNAAKVTTPSQNAAWRAVGQIAGWVRQRWASYNPIVQGGNILQNSLQAEGIAARHGVRWLPVFLKEDLPAFIKARKNPGSDPFFEAYARNSRAFSGESGMLGEVGSSLRNSVGIDTPAQKFTKGVKKLSESPMTGFSRIEELFKYSLFKRLVKAGKSEEEAARITDRALFDHMDVDGTVALLNKYGPIPFLSTKIKGLENATTILLNNPDILLRYSGLRLAQALSHAAGPEAEKRGIVDEKTGKLRFYAPGTADENGVPIAYGGGFLDVNPLSVDRIGLDQFDPFRGGVFAPALNALRNDDPFKREVTGDSFIVKPGELPPLDAILKRADVAAEAYAPLGTLTPYYGREARRISRGMRGVSQYGGAGSEPETPGRAILRAFTGIRVMRTENAAEKNRRKMGNAVERLPNQIFQAQYEAAVRSGQVKRRTWPEHMLPKTPEDALAWARAALDNLRQYTLGAQDVQGSLEAQAKIRYFTDWFLQAEEHAWNQWRLEFTPENLMRAGGGG